MPLARHTRSGPQVNQAGGGPSLGTAARQRPGQAL